MKLLTYILVFFILILLIALCWLNIDKSTSTIKSNNVLFLDKQTTKVFFKNNITAKEYLNSIDPTTSYYKLGTHDNLSNYSNYFQTFSKPEQNILRKAVSLLPKNKLLGGTWKLAKTSTSLEFSMPFTLGDVIFFSPLKSSSPLEYKRTLVHERMHILQRDYPTMFNKFLIERLGFRLVKIKKKKLPFTIFSNPDGLQLDSASWIFPVKNYISNKNNKTKWFCPFLTINKSGNLEKIAVQVKYIKKATVRILTRVEPVVKLLKARFPSCPSHHLYHPYEIMAELGMMWVLEGTSSNKEIDNFYSNLSKVIN